VREVSLEGSRVSKYRHTAREAMQVDTRELVVLAELFLRGPQTVGELRGHASRMHPLESMEVVENVLAGLSARQPPMVKFVPPSPGSRTGRWAQLLCPTLHPLDAPTAAGGVAPPTAATRVDSGLAARVAELEREVEALRAEIQLIRSQAAR
jgi:uncharacterized protein YceH (UPF0502 family)